MGSEADVIQQWQGWLLVTQLGHWECLPNDCRGAPLCYWRRGQRLLDETGQPRAYEVCRLMRCRGPSEILPNWSAAIPPTPCDLTKMYRWARGTKCRFQSLAGRLLSHLCFRFPEAGRLK